MQYSNIHSQAQPVAASGEAARSASGFWLPVAGSRLKTEIISIRPVPTELPPRRHNRKSGVKSLIVFQAIMLLVMTAGIPEVGGDKAALPDRASLTSTILFRQPKPALRTWEQMAEAERAAFVNEKAANVSAMLGENPHAFSHEAVQAIKKYVEEYAARVGVSREKSGVEGLSDVFIRASSYAPVIVRAFRERHVPVIVGLYLPIIESEYRVCLESPYGAKGLFQFIPASARAYGAEPKDLCNAEKMAPVAAQYIADRVTEFGTDARSMTLVLLSFNRNPDTVRRDLTQLRRENPGLDRSFWSLFANADKLDGYFRQESRNYVPKFFAAAIVGENPEVFGLPMPPLSSHSQ
ncbi:MAG: transglycosylase SLT domain-containing protein [Blastocatellia bacterium]